MQDEVRPFAERVDRLDGAVESLEVVDAVDQGPLPAAFEVEVVIRGIVEVEREAARLEAGEDQTPEAARKPRRRR